MYTIYITVLSLLCTVVQSSLCHICGIRGNEDLSPYKVLSGEATNCATIAIKVAMSITNERDCSAQQTKYKQCCTKDHEAPSPGGVLPPQSIPSVRYTGPYQRCNICRDKDFPSETSMVVNFLYIGPGTCVQYWKIGQAGKIPDHLCSVVQYFSYEPCGCGEHNPYFTKNNDK